MEHHDPNARIAPKCSAHPLWLRIGKADANPAAHLTAWVYCCFFASRAMGEPGSPAGLSRPETSWAWAGYCLARGLRGRARGFGGCLFCAGGFQGFLLSVPGRRWASGLDFRVWRHFFGRGWFSGRDCELTQVLCRDKCRLRDIGTGKARCWHSKYCASQHGMTSGLPGMPGKFPVVFARLGFCTSPFRAPGMLLDSCPSV
jgi:hypothetical protein